jgi:hypothetical protein
MTADRAIQLNNEDIEHARKRDQYGCAIVRAIQRQYPEALRVRVNAKLVGFTIKDIRYTYPTPPEAVEQIIKPFDQGKNIEPTVVRLRAGKMRETTHGDDRQLEMKRGKKRNMPRTERADQMSPHYHEFERFKK